MLAWGTEAGTVFVMAAIRRAARRIALTGVIALSPWVRGTTGIGNSTPGFELPSANTELTNRSPILWSKVPLPPSSSRAFR